MNPVTEMFLMGGPAMYGLLLLVIVVPMLLLVCASFSVTGWRVPAPLWLLGPLLTVLVGELATLQGQVLATEAIAWASPEAVVVLGWAGASTALITDLSGLYAGSLLLLGVLWLLGPALIVAPGEAPRWTPVPAALAIAIPLLGAPAVGALALIGKTGPGGWLPALFLLLGGIPLALGCAREGSPEKRVHTGRQVLALAFLLGTAWCALAGWQLGNHSLYALMVDGDPAMLSELEAFGKQIQQDLLVTGALSVGVALLASSCAMLFSLRHSFDLRSIAGASVVAVGVLTSVALEVLIVVNGARLMG